MNLKKSLELQNYLSELQKEATDKFYSKFMMNVQRHHYISAVNADVKDYTETIDDSLKTECNFVTPNQLIRFAEYVMNQRVLLMGAIAEAKSEGQSYDLLIAQNSERRTQLVHFEYLQKLKGVEFKHRNEAYKFNVNGEQVSYEYDIKDVTTIDFDRNMVKSIVTKLRKECEDVSETIDRILIMRDVDFECIFDIGDTFEDAVAKYLAEVGEVAQ